MPRHPKWGRPIKEYFFQDIPGSFFSDGPVTEACAPFSRTLSLLRYPDKLRTIDNTMSLSNTVKALQNSDYTGGYASQANQASGITTLLFSYEYGFLAFRCIILFMQAGILAHTNSFSLFERRAKDLSDPHAISVALSNFVMEFMYESLEKPNPRDWLLGILTSQRGGRMFLRTVGGFYDDDVDILLRALWDDRKNFLSIITKAPGLIPGWGLPLMLIGEHLMWAKECQIEKGDEWSMLQALCFRYSVVAPDPELKMMTANCIRAEFYGYPTTPEDDPGANEFHQKSIVDVDDAWTFLVNYIHRAIKPKVMVLPSELAIQLVGFARQDAILDIIYWMPSLLEISCLWTWRFVGWLPDMTTGSVSAVYLVIHATRVLDLIGRLFSKHVAAPSKTISTFVKALARQDIVELCGRLLMFPLTMGSNITQIAEEHPETFNRVIDPTKPFFVPYVWSLLVHRVASVATSYSMSGRPSNGILSPQYEQWLKVWRCFEADFPQHESSTESFLAYKRSASAAWLSLGSSFSFADRRARTKMECSNPRCPGVGLEHASPLTCEHCPSAVYCSNWCQSLLGTETRYLKKYLLLAGASRMDRNYNSPMHPYNFLWNEDKGTGRPGFYPFLFGIDGMGEIHANDPDPLVTLAPPRPPPDTTLGEQLPSASDQPTLSSQPGVVSYALPTPNIPLSLRVGTLTVVAPGPVLSVSTTISPTSLASTSVIQTPVQAAATTSTLESPLVVMSMPLTSLVMSSLASSAISVSSPNASEAVLTSTIVPAPSSPAASPPGEPSKHKHELVFCIALALIVLVLLGTICTSLSWIMRRRRKQRAQAENELWIGQVLRDEPDVHSIYIKQDHGDFELEKGNTEYVGPGAAGIGIGHRGGTHYRGEDFGLGVPPRGYGLGNEFNTQGFANVQPSRRYPSLLQRGAPTAAEYPHHGLDHGGLTFRHDPGGRLTFQPTRANLDDISTPNPHEHPAYPNPHDDPSVRRPAPVMATQPGAASHYSYEGAGPLAVTNLMPGDISSRTSEVSLGKMTGRLAVDNGGPARSLGLPTGRLDNPNPWRRYDGVENRGGVMGMDLNGETETKGWGATIRSGIYSAVGRLVGAPGEDPEGEKRSDRDKDRFTEIVKRRRLPRDSEGTPSEYEIKLGHQDDDKPDDPDGPKVPAGETSQSRSPSEKHEYQANWREILEERRVRNMVPDSRGWIIEEESADGSRGKVHIASGARDRILRRLGSTSTRMSSTTAYSTDVDAVFTSAATTRANTIATSRRDTMSTRWSGCRRRENSRTGEMRAQERALSPTSSDWGTLSMAKALGMELGGPTSRSHGPL